MALVALLAIVGCRSPGADLLAGNWTNDKDIFDAKPGVVRVEIRADGSWTAAIHDEKLSWIEGEQVDGVWRLSGDWSLVKGSWEKTDESVKGILLLTSVVEDEERTGEVPFVVAGERLILDNWIEMEFVRDAR